jgi:hypothetical protein
VQVTALYSLDLALIYRHACSVCLSCFEFSQSSVQKSLYLNPVTISLVTANDDDDDDNNNNNYSYIVQ